jgi:tRNA pseudouridine synthase 10
MANEYSNTINSRNQDAASEEDTIQNAASEAIEPHSAKVEEAEVTLDPSLRDHPEGNGQCSLCHGLFTETDTFADLVVTAFSDFEFDSYLIGCVLDDDIIKAENDIQQEMGLTDCAEGIKSELNRVIGLKVFDKIGKDVSFEKPDIVGVVDTRFDSISLQLSPIFLYGRYLKFDRTIPQTIWNCKRCRGKGCEYCEWSGKMYQTSVQEIIGNVILEDAGGTRHLFHGMGREDIDARMLGTGRPFILEISAPKKRNLDLKELTERVNSFSPDKVKITGLTQTVRENVSKIKNMKVDKSYLAEIEFEDDITEEQLKDLEREFTGKIISQRTPTRVVHRRSDRIRERKVININCRLLDDRHSAFTIKGESGLYIKELIHGNEGRTQPSVSEYLKNGCKVLSLDVLEVHYDENLDQR